LVLVIGNLGSTYLKKVTFNINNEMIISHGAIGAKAEAKAGEINAITLVEQQTTPLANAEVPDIVVEIEDTKEERLVLELRLVSAVFISQ
jgi:hypothetical protein